MKAYHTVAVEERESIEASRNHVSPACMRFYQLIGTRDQLGSPAIAERRFGPRKGG